MPVTAMELVIYLLCVAPNEKRISKIKFRKISSRIVTQKQNSEMWSTDEDVPEEEEYEDDIFKTTTKPRFTSSLVSDNQEPLLDPK